MVSQPISFSNITKSFYKRTSRFKMILPTALKGLFVVTVAWTIGRLGFSFAWPLLGLFIYLTQFAFLRRPIVSGLDDGQTTRISTTINPRDDIALKPHFPDKERAEWINKIFHHLWPFLDSAVNRIVDQKEKDFIEALPDYLKSLRIDRVNLGTVPIRISAVKCYEESTSGEIILDVDVSYNGNADVEVVLRGLKAGVKNITLSGVLRIELKPLIREQPIIGGVNVYFLSRPTLSFELTNAAEFIDLPMINEILTESILDEMAKYLVIPNKVSIILANRIPRQEVQMYLPLGVLRFELMSGRRLRRADISLLGLGKSDPYAIIAVQGQSFRTKTVKSKINPKWNYAIEVPIYQVRGQRVIIEVMDEDKLKPDDYLGKASLSLDKIVEAGVVEVSADLTETETGAIQYKASFLTLSEDPKSLVNHFDVVDALSRKYPKDTRESNQTVGSVAIVCIYLDHIKSGLDEIDNGELGNYHIRVRIGDYEKSSRAVAPDGSLILEDNFHFLIDSLEQIIFIELMSDNNKQPIGHADITTSELLDAARMTYDGELVLNSDNSVAKAVLKTVIAMRLLREPGDYDEMVELGSDLSDVENLADGHEVVDEQPAQIAEHIINRPEPDIVTEPEKPHVQFQFVDESGAVKPKILLTPPETTGLSMTKPITPSEAEAHERLFAPMAVRESDNAKSAS